MTWAPVETKKHDGWMHEWMMALPQPKNSFHQRTSVALAYTNPELNLDKNEIPVLGLDIVTRQVYYFSS